MIQSQGIVWPLVKRIKGSVHKTTEAACNSTWPLTQIDAGVGQFEMRKVLKGAPLAKKRHSHHMQVINILINMVGRF